MSVDKDKPTAGQEWLAEAGLDADALAALAPGGDEFLEEVDEEEAQALEAAELVVKPRRLVHVEGVVAIIGRPNVGKSTLFNRLTRSDAAIVDDQPGVTRDRIYGTSWTTALDDNDEEIREGFVVIDTGGFETKDLKYQPFSENLVWQQTEAAVAEADLVLLVLDAKAGLHPHDKELVRFLEKQRKPYKVVANKIDGIEQGEILWDFFELGLDEIERISAAHNRGVGDLKELLTNTLKTLPNRRRRDEDPDAVRIAIVGRPNAGKSSLLNRLTGEERAVVSEIAGTTRDSLDTPLTFNNRRYMLIDTAGIRRKSRIDEKLESLSVVRSLRAIEHADIVLLMVDADAGLTEQDARLASLAADRHIPLVVVVNKWDLVTDKTSKSTREYADAIRREIKSMAYAPIEFVSCKTNQRVHRLWQVIEKLTQQGRKRAPTATVNAALRQMVQEHTPALFRSKARRVKFYFATQVSISPPTIVVFCNVYDEIHEAYIRYMTHRFRKALGFDDIPVKLIFRPKAVVRERAAESDRT
jgi:GTP-binding protein